MNRTKRLLSATCILAAIIPLIAQTKPDSTSSKTNGSKSLAAEAGDAARGERVFQQNCSRCHNPPQGFSPQISGTILRHMRVRASLSKADERDLLRFMNP
jgi:mono/diheme cytochrome c family protein